MNKTLSSVVIAVTSLLIIVAVGRYAYTEYPAFFGKTPIAEQKPVAPLLNGSLIMTMRPQVPINSPSGIYAISAQGGTVKKVDDAHDYYAPSFSTDGRVAVTAAVGSSSVQLMLVKVSDKDHPKFVIPPSPTLVPGASSWSLDNKYIVYEAVSALPTVDDISITNSRIILLDVTTGVQKILDTGASPLFAKDGSVFYLKSDGIYRIDADGLAASSSAEHAARVAYFEEYQASRNSRLALSHDGAMVIASHPHSNGLVVYYATTTPSFALTQAGIITTQAAFPVFSPDDVNLAFIELSKDAEGHPTRSISIANIRTLQKNILTKLDAYTDLLSLAAWIR